MFPKNLIRDFVAAVAVMAFLGGMVLAVLAPMAWGWLQPIIHAATAGGGQ